uniref:SCAN box domain-containing protein n=1 Tax=Pelusios castaneus TaxID=367368 RepID=A0A8C8RPH9_9SAUR
HAASPLPHGTAILDALDISPETFRRCFRSTAYAPGTRPWVFAQELKDACTRWLQPERRTGHELVELVEQVVLEQFLHALPPRGRSWVMRHQPPTLDRAIRLMEDFLAADATAPPLATSPGLSGFRGAARTGWPSRDRSQLTMTVGREPRLEGPRLRPGLLGMGVSSQNR